MTNTLLLAKNILRDLPVKHNRLCEDKFSCKKRQFVKHSIIRNESYANIVNDGKEKKKKLPTCLKEYQATRSCKGSGPRG
jgi:hypothetical protein